MAIESIFGKLSENLQVLVDTRMDKFNQPWYQKFFPFDTPQISLDYSTVLGEAVVNAMASVVARDAETPLRARQAMRKLTGEIPAIREMIPLNENEYRNYMALQNLPNLADKTQKNNALQLIWNDTERVVNSIHNRLDFLALQAVSTGTINLDIDNNPDGIVTGAIDLLMPEENKFKVFKAWTDANLATATPIQDILNVVNTAGSPIERILIDRKTFSWFMKSKEVKDTMGAFFGLTRTATASETAPITLNRVNQYMTESEMPVFEIMNRRSVIEKNGVSGAAVNPFDENILVFVPAGNLGVIKSAFAVEEMRPIEKISYANAGRILVSKWAVNEPFREWTKAELNAFPVLTNINSIFHLDKSTAA